MAAPSLMPGSRGEPLTRQASPFQQRTEPVLGSTRGWGVVVWAGPRRESTEEVKVSVCEAWCVWWVRVRSGPRWEMRAVRDSEGGAVVVGEGEGEGEGEEGEEGRRVKRIPHIAGVEFVFI